MSEYYQIYVLIPDGITSFNAVYTTNELLSQTGGCVIQEESLCILNDISDCEFDPEYVIDPAQALSTLAKWPTYGSIDYLTEDLFVLVSYNGIPFANVVQVIKLSFGQRSFEKGGLETEMRYKQLAEAFHKKFRAKRTIMDWGIDYKGFDWQNEISNLKRNDFKRGYTMLDMRS